MHAIGLGPTAKDLQAQIDSIGDLHLGTFPKEAFGMLIPEVDSILKESRHQNVKNILLCGIEVSLVLQPITNDCNLLLVMFRRIYVSFRRLWTCKIEGTQFGY
jgi:hypothetical protein